MSNDQNSSSDTSVLQTLTKNLMVGQVTVTAATPFLGMTNHMANGGKFAWRHFSYAGYLSYTKSILPTTFVAMSTYAGLQNFFCKDQEASDGLKIVFGVASGVIAGIPATPFEGAAQLKQAAKKEGKLVPSDMGIFKSAWRYHGARGVFSGVLSVMMREGQYAVCYLTFVDMLSQRIQLLYPQKEISDFFSAVMIGVIFGVASTPLNNKLRFQKQAAMASEGKIPTYREIIKNTYVGAPGSAPLVKLGIFFQGWKPRTISSVTAVGSLTLAKKAIEYLEGNIWSPR